MIDAAFGTPLPPPPLRAAGSSRVEHAWAVLSTVLDPEVPVVSVVDLGIVPPGRVDIAKGVPLRFVPRAVAPLACPRCDSTDTERLAAFGATACKALWRCRACGEPFEHFKPI